MCLHFFDHEPVLSEVVNIAVQANGAHGSWSYGGATAIPPELELAQSHVTKKPMPQYMTMTLFPLDQFATYLGLMFQ